MQSHIQTQENCYRSSCAFIAVNQTIRRTDTLFGFLANFTRNIFSVTTNLLSIIPNPLRKQVCCKMKEFATKRMPSEGDKKIPMQLPVLQMCLSSLVQFKTTQAENQKADQLCKIRYILQQVTCSDITEYGIWLMFLCTVSRLWY